ncbi:hypothetical protein BT96DRAFT_950697 [Gymnopus androsaceus JB14]|uniref:Uncharacterized protein n=1 Tax=Gymnopus androsaceus JB14 TaxID=1447944 RepID=A0A6A4GFS5_9AGAR|nr:hypothetical protein BT96DRAFT_950697 [Gymnopus androsaceus JB14]
MWLWCYSCLFLLYLRPCSWMPKAGKSETIRQQFNPDYLKCRFTQPESKRGAGSASSTDSRPLAEDDSNTDWEEENEIENEAEMLILQMKRITGHENCCKDYWTCRD